MRDDEVNLSASAQRVQDELARNGLKIQVVELPDSTRTAQEAAEAVQCEVGQIVKSLVFRGGNSGEGAVLVLTSGANRVDEDVMSKRIGNPITMADPKFVREKTGYAIGGVPPLGHTTPLPTFIDRSLMDFDFVWAAAGTPRAVFRLTPDELLKLTKGEVLAVS